MLTDDILRVLNLFAHEYNGWVPHNVLLGQLQVVGYWPNLRSGGKLNMKAFARADMELREAMESLEERELIAIRDTAYFRLTDRGEAAAAVAEAMANFYGLVGVHAVMAHETARGPKVGMRKP